MDNCHFPAVILSDRIAAMKRKWRGPCSLVPLFMNTLTFVVAGKSTNLPLDTTQTYYRPYEE